MKMVWILVLGALFCKGDKNSYNDTIAILLGVSPKYSPTITSIEPKKLNPEIRSSSAYHPPSQVTIRGRNFSVVSYENLVLFNDIPATVIYSTEKEILTTVPNGVKSGLVSVSKQGGICNSLDKKSGINCSATEYYVDCYKPYNNIYKDEILLEVGKLNKIEYTTNGTNAYRVDLPQGEFKINIFCPSQVIVQYFTPTCEAIDVYNDNINLLLNPTIFVTGGYTLQFFVSASKGTCTISILN